jgi:hypothetical protein
MQVFNSRADEDVRYHKPPELVRDCKLKLGETPLPAQVFTGTARKRQISASYQRQEFFAQSRYSEKTLLSTAFLQLGAHPKNGGYSSMDQGEIIAIFPVSLSRWKVGKIPGITKGRGRS